MMTSKGPASWADDLPDEQWSDRSATVRRDILFEAIVESLGDGILIVDAENRVLLANNHFLEMWSIERDVIDSGTSVLLAEAVKDQLADPDLFLARVQALPNADEDSVEDLVFRDGRVVERLNRPLLERRQITGRLLIFRDVSSRRLAEEARRNMENRVQAAQKLESLGALAGGIAHEFNNMLMTMLGNVDLLQRELPATGLPAEYLNEIQGAGRRAADLCNQMLAFSGQGQFALERLDLGQLINEMRGILTISMAKNVHLSCHFAADPPPISADAGQIRQLVLNLVSNAADACGSDGGSVFLRTGAADFDRDWLSDCIVGASLTPGPYVFLEVRDTGSGMSETITRRAFEPFFSTKLVGRGLGLPAVLGIMFGHGGALKLTSESGRGTTGTVCFPVAKVAEPETTQHTRQQSQSGGRAVLLVEDEPGVRRVGVAILERAGFRVLTAGNGVEALEVCAEHADEIGCVVLDLTMPHMGGRECFENLCDRWPQLPVILASGYAEQEATNDMRRGELAGFLQKPFEPERLVDLVRGLI